MILYIYIYKKNNSFTTEMTLHNEQAFFIHRAKVHLIYSHTPHQSNGSWETHPPTPDPDVIFL